MAACVKMRGLPWSVNEQMVIDFFHPIPVTNESIVFLYNHEGRLSGSGFVWMHESNIQQALSRNRNMMGNRYLELFASTEEEYNHDVQRSGPKAQLDEHGRPSTMQHAQESVIRVRGLPFHAQASELAQTFAHLGVKEKDCFLALVTTGARRGSPSGDAFIRFADQETAQTALETLQNAMLGNRYLELFASSEGALDALQAASGIAGQAGALEPQRGDDLNPQDDRPGSGWLRLRGLPYSATQHDVVTFCGSAVFVNENDVTIKYGTDGRPTGEAFVQLQSQDLAHEAQRTLDRQNMGARFIEAFVSSWSESQAVRHNSSRPGKGGPYDRPDAWGGKGGYDYGGKGYGKGYGKAW